LCHDLDAGIENFVAGQDELRFAATEELREQLSEVPVDRIVGFLQLFARFAVDTADRILERIDGGRQVPGLVVEEALALPRDSQFLQRRQVDRSERLDLGVQPCDVAAGTARRSIRPPAA
jgi:hypothetical protein